MGTLASQVAKEGSSHGHHSLGEWKNMGRRQSVVQPYERQTAVGGEHHFGIGTRTFKGVVWSMGDHDWLLDAFSENMTSQSVKPRDSDLSWTVHNRKAGPRQRRAERERKSRCKMLCMVKDKSHGRHDSNYVVGMSSRTLRLEAFPHWWPERGTRRSACRG